MADSSIQVRYKPSYFHNPGTEPLSPLTVGQLLDLAVEKWGKREVIVSLYQGHRFTFNEIRDKTDRLAAGLLQLGLNPGDRLGIWGPNSSEWYISRLAAARGGYIAVQIDPAYQTPQLLNSLNKVEVKALICAETFKSSIYYEMVCKLLPELDTCPESGVELNSAKIPSLKTLVVISDKQYRGAYRFDDIIKSANPESMRKIRELQELIQPDEGCNIQFSSGTTGFPKAVLSSHHAAVNNANICGKLMGYDGTERKLVLIVQFCHMSGTLGGVIYTLVFGTTIVIPAPSFDAKKALDAIRSEGVSSCFGSPSLYVDMISTAREHGMTFSTLEIAAYGGAPCTPQLAQEMKEIFNCKILFPIYGLTETGTNLVGHPRDTLEQMISTVGSVGDHLEVKVVDSDGRMVPMGKPGELWVRGYSVMKEYWGDEEKTNQFKTKDGWAKTGDLFILQENGYGKIVGRLKDAIIRFGDKIFPAELEEFFQEHPDILEAQVFGIPDPKVGEEICVFIRSREEITLTEGDIISYCKDKIPDYRIPRYIRFVNQFPRSAMGKVLKTRLLETLQQEISALTIK